MSDGAGAIRYGSRSTSTAGRLSTMPAAATGTRRARRPNRLLRLAFAPIDGASLAFIRIAFGGIMALDGFRYLLSPAMSSIYVDPPFHFTYFGFSWAKPWPGAGMQLHFAAMAAAGILVALGAWYRIAIAALALLVTHQFLMDQATYLNHMYLVSLLAILLAFIPAHAELSVDAWRRRAPRSVPAWALWILRFQIAIPYVYGGIAKLNEDWLAGRPLDVWLVRRSDFPVIGGWFSHPSAHYFFAWSGLILDLAVVPLLLWRRTRAWAFGFAVAFHLLNAGIFDIGIFPWTMIAATCIFFPADFPRRLFRRLPRRTTDSPIPPKRAVLAALFAWVAIQVVVPFRHWLHPGVVHWTELGHRFSWHMKLREKIGSLSFTVWTDGQSRLVIPPDELTQKQWREMCTRPDMILQYAHRIAERRRAAGAREVRVHANCLMSLNGRPHATLIDPAVDLAAEPRTLGTPRWILPLPER